MRPKRGDDKEVPKVLKNKKNELSLISLLALIFSSVLFVSAVVINSTNNSNNGLILNDTLPNIPANTNITLINDTANLPIPIYNVSLQNKSVIVNENISRLAKIFNEDNLDFDREFKRQYLELHKNFSTVKFKNISAREDYILKVGAKQDKIRGIAINESNFVIDLLYCELSGRYCAFRINGVPAARLHSFNEFGNTQQNSFDIDGNYILKVNSIKFNHCDNKRFCHLGYEGYNIVNISIKRKNG